MSSDRALGRRWVVPAVVGAVVLLIVGYLLWCYEIFPPPALGPTPAWRGIMLGQTTLDEALEILGGPDESEVRGEYLICIYREHITWGWRAVEVWAQEREGQRITVGILRALPNEPTETASDVQILDDLVSVYERPDEVTWAGLEDTRVLIWARRGVVAEVGARLRRFSWRAQEISSILIFEPMGIHEFLRREWPWGGRAYAPIPRCRSPYAIGEQGNVLPQDPYDWDEILSSLP